MAYLTLNEINSHSCYAPLGFEKEFQTRIKNDIYTIIENLDTTKTFKANKIAPEYFDKVETLLDPSQLDDEDLGFIPEYRAGTHLEFMASWDDYGVYWKRRGKGYQRKVYKEQLLNNFDEYYSML